MLKRWAILIIIKKKRTKRKWNFVNADKNSSLCTSWLLKWLRRPCERAFISSAAVQPRADLWWRAQVNSTLRWRWDTEILVITYIHYIYLFDVSLSSAKMISIIPVGVFGVLFWDDVCKWGCGNWLLLTVLCRIAVVTSSHRREWCASAMNTCVCWCC